MPKRSVYYQYVWTNFSGGAHLQVVFNHYVESNDENYCR